MKQEESINDRIRELIETEGHSLSTFSKKINTSWQSLSNIVKDRNLPSYDFIIKILENVRGVDAGWLLTGRHTNEKFEEQIKNMNKVIEGQQKTIASQQKTIEGQQKTIENLTNIISLSGNMQDKKMSGAG